MEGKGTGPIQFQSTGPTTPNLGVVASGRAACAVRHAPAPSFAAGPALPRVIIPAPAALWPVRLDYDTITPALFWSRKDVALRFP